MQNLQWNWVSPVSVISLQEPTLRLLKKCNRICSIYVLNVARAAFLGPEQRLRILLSSICAQNLYRETPATFWMQIEQFERI
jgi:hypothetical protein